MPRLWKTVTALVLMVALLAGISGAAVQAAPKKYDPFNDPRPAQGKVDPSIVVTAEKAKALGLDNRPVRDGRVKVRAGETFSTFSATQAVSMQGTPIWQYNSFDFSSGVNKGILAGVSVIGGLSLTKPGLANEVAVENGVMGVSGSCLSPSFIHHLPPGHWSTYHYFAVLNVCNGQRTHFTVNSSTWTKYISTGNVTSITDIGVQIPDKYSYVRVYNTYSTCWNVEVWNVNTGSYDVFATDCTANPNGGTYVEFDHYGYNVVGSGYCTQLGPWNIHNTFGINKFVPGSGWTPLVTADIVGSTVSSASPCMNNGGSGAWYWADTGPIAPGGGPAFSVCGPWDQRCRP